MNQAIKALAKRTPIVRSLYQHVRKGGAYPAGHYYSPVPAREDVLNYVNSTALGGQELLGISLNQKDQGDALDDYVKFYHQLPFREKETAGHRYYYDNPFFSYSDSIFLYSFLRRHEPKRIVEIGSGFSSAAMLDTIDVCFQERPELTFVDPYPDRLLGLLKTADLQHLRLLDKKVQDVPLEVFEALESGDLLFIDSSHVVKCGSDLQFIMFTILPRLKPGVFVHFHDIFFPFDYPTEWLVEGRYWNESYFLRAFLSYNAEWQIRFFNTYVHQVFGETIREKMPLCARNPGGSLYIQRIPRI